MSEESRPRLRIVRGRPDDAEIAALVVTLLRPAAASESEPVSSPWTDRRSMLAAPVPPGPGAWQRSGRIPGARTRAHW